MTEALRSLLVTLAEPWVDPASRTFAPWLVLAMAIAAAHHLARGGRPADLVGAVLPARLWTHASTRVDAQLLVVRQLLGVALATGVRAGGAMWVGTTVAMALDDTLGVPSVPAPPLWLLTAGYTLALFVAWDASRFVLHRWMHTVPALWEIHQVHHSAEVLTPLTFHRVHPLESVLYGLRGLLVDGGMAALAFWLFRAQATPWTLLGVHGVGLIASALTGNLRHSHVWLRFPAPMERWLLSPAQHQLHHSADPADHDTNYGTWLAVWDRLAGTLRLAGPTPPATFGVLGGNHAPDDLLGALLGPLRGWRRAWLPALLLLPLVARAEDEEDEDEDVAYEIVVTDESGVPRVAGSAHVVSEEELQRYGYTDIQKVLGRVPGVYTRGEDGYGLRPNIGLRGANSDRSSKVALMEDGIPLAPAPYAAPAAYYFPMTQRMVGVEVYKGPAAIQYGPQTIGGAVNVLTRATPRGPDGAVDVALGQYAMARMHAWAGTGNRTWGLLVEGTHLSTSGFKELDDGGPTGFVRQDAMLKVRRSDGERVRSTLELKLGYGREASDETYLGLSLDDFEQTPYRRYAASQDDHMAWNRTQEELTWRLVLGPRVELRSAVWHHWLGRTWTKFNRFAGGPDVHDLLLAPAAGQAADQGPRQGADGGALDHGAGHGLVLLAQGHFLGRHGLLGLGPLVAGRLAGACRDGDHEDQGDSLCGFAHLQLLCRQFPQFNLNYTPGEPVFHRSRICSSQVLRSIRLSFRYMSACDLKSSAKGISERRSRLSNSTARAANWRAKTSSG
ncbi:MAG: sterol desaturase family protein [Myxococcales bacterium]|nr:sterol desaturase family protein [Myxococcales bacterium]